MGWDTVFAVPIDRINKAIVKRKVSPKKLDYKIQAASKFHMQADFGDWQIIPKGDGSIIRMSLPMKNMKGGYTVSGKDYTFTCDECVGIIEIKLNFLPHDHSIPIIGGDGKALPDPPKGTKRHKLVARTKSDDPADPVASFVVLDFIKPLSLPGAKTSIEAAFEAWCNENLEQFSHIFTIVDLNDKIASGKWAFCKPHITNYAYVDKGTPETSILGVLCMTSNDPVPQVQEVTNFAIPENCQASFLINAKRFLKDMIKPSLSGIWSNLKPSDLEVASNNKMIQLKSGRKISLPQITTKDGDKYTPVMSMFSLEIMGDELKVDMHTDVEVSSGIHATCTSTNWFRIKLGKNKKGKQTLVYEDARKPVKTTGHYHDEGIVILKDILIVIGIILSLLSIVVDDGAGLVVAAALVTCLVGQYELNNIEMAHQNDAPALDDLSSSFNTPIIWPDSKDFDLQTAGMAESLQLGGIWNG